MMQEPDQPDQVLSQVPGIKQQAKHLLLLGPVGELIIATNKTQFLKKMGAYTPDSMAPDCALDYYDLANGAGGLLLVRITDGNEVQSEMTLYARDASQTPMGTIKAANGGRWGGKEQFYTDDLALADDLTDTTMDTGVTTWTTDQWKGGYIELDELPNYRFPITGNDNTGLITVAADQKMKTLFDASGGGDLRYHLVLENEGKALSIEIGDGEEKPTEEFSLTVYVDGNYVKKYPNLSTDPNSSRYWVSLINDDDSNDEIVVTDLWTGAHAAWVRPANHYGVIDTGLTDTVLPAVIHEFAHTVGDADATVTLDATDDDMKPQKITIVMDDATTATVTSDKFGPLGAAAALTVGTPFVPNTKWAPEFTITNGAEALEAGDTMVLNYKPFKPDALIGGYVYPDKVNAPNVKFRIVDNDHDSITAADGSTMLTDGAPADEFMVVAPLELTGGRNGNADLVDADYSQQAWDTATSPFNRIFGKNLGLVKFATPGVISTAVEKAGAAYANAKNHQYRYEIPKSVTTEQGAIDHINDTLGRTEYAVAAFPSWCSVPDPEATEPGKLKETPNTGMIHGREARIAADYNGYHKAEAGLDAILPKILKIPTGDAILNEEMLNPVGIAVIKKLKGNFIIWGDRTLHLDPTWKWKHQREMMSYYEHVLQENFDWIVFAINDPVTEKMALAALNSYFEPEWVKRALRGASDARPAILILSD